MSILDVVYSSAPTSEVLIMTLEMSAPTAFETIYICDGFEDQTITLDTSVGDIVFTAEALEIDLPKKDTSGQQILTLKIDNVTGVAQQAIDAAYLANEEVSITLRIYLSSDLTTPAEPPLYLTLSGCSFSGSTVEIQASYFDLLNTQWPRDRYTLQFAPALAFM